MSKPKAFRLFYRNSKAGSGYFASYRQEVIFGEAELERRKALKRPVLVHWERAVTWQCHACRKRGPWVAGWRIMPGRSGGANGWGNPVHICSDACAAVHRPGYVQPSFIRTDDEPTPSHHKRLMRARWDAFQADRDAKTQTREHRKVPMFHEGKGVGWCRWCGKAVKPPRQTWHEECFREYNRHTNPAAQAWFLSRRDGPTCKVEGCEETGTDVDHVVPLWRVRDLPDLERLAYYGPDNLQLLCADHHKAKTAREAGERAAQGKARQQEKAHG